MINNKKFNPEMENALAKMQESPEFIDKFMYDESESNNKTLMPKQKSSRKCSIARVRNHNFAHRQWRKFISFHPGIDTVRLSGLDCYNAIFCGGPYDNINIYNHMFLSKRGDIRILRGKIQVLRKDKGFITGPSSLIKDIKKHTNRCVRHMPVNEDNCNKWNYYRKQHLESFD